MIFKKRLVLLTALAAFPMSAVVSASPASAEATDGWQTCQEKAGGLFENRGCVKEGTTKAFEWVTLAAGKTDNVVSSGGDFEFVAGGKRITCKKVKSEGTITGGNPGTDETAKVTFEECTTGQAGCRVKSAGGKLGTIEVTKIPSKLEQLKVGEKEVEADVFEQKTVENAKKELVKEFVTLAFEAETGKACSEYTETKVKGDVAAETAADSGELIFPSTPLKITPKLEGFGVSAALTGKDTQTLENGAAVRAIPPVPGPEFWQKGKVIPKAIGFTSANVGNAVIKWGPAPANEITCTGSSDSGKVEAAAKLGEVAIKDTGCKSNTFFGENECYFNGNPNKAGEIKFEKLRGGIGYTKPRNGTSTGAELEPVAGNTIAKIKCVEFGAEAPQVYELTGCYVAEVTPVNEEKTEVSLVLAEQGVKQRFTELIGGVHSPCELSIAGETARLDAKETLTFTNPEKVEVKA